MPAASGIVFLSQPADAASPVARWQRPPSLAMQFRQRTLILQDLTERERRQRSRPLPQAGGYGGIEKAATGRGPEGGRQVHELREPHYEG